MVKRAKVVKRAKALELAELIENNLAGAGDMEIAAELRRLHRIEDAFNTWLEKTKWVQETAGVRDLGKHRADVMKDRIDRLQTQRDDLLEALQYLMVASGEQLTSAFEQAQEAIAEATGEQP